VIAQLSDFHVRLGDDSLRALETAVQAVLDLKPLPDAVLASGDLADGGLPAEYAAVRERLDRLPMPVHAIPGNHDNRDAMIAAFGPTRWMVTCGPLRLVGCDTLVAGSNGGALGEEQLAWLDAELGGDRDTPTIVAMHHPPILTGIAAADAVGLADRDQLGSVLARHPQVRRVVAGHVHRAVAGRIGTCGVLVCPSVNFQLSLDLTPHGEIEVPPEPPGIAVHALVGGELVTHVQTTSYRP
jgi:3',5'-cyclic-AMP phosphodiesterase